MTVLTHIVQVKVPVSDLAASVAWYRKLFQLELAAEFVEEGMLRGCQPRLIGRPIPHLSA
jgi:catechol 2,3-dioxygenase-like lactoylglutathione lyase family enzyme